MTQEPAQFDEIKFVVYGNPKAQKRHRMARRGNYIAQIDDSKEDKATMLAKIMQYRPEAPWTGPIAMKVHFVVPRPQSHFRTSGDLKASAPDFCPKKPDIDNFIKAALDCLNGVFFLDDAQVVWIEATKEYSGLPERPRTEVTLRQLTR